MPDLKPAVDVTAPPARQAIDAGAERLPDFTLDGGRLAPAFPFLIAPTDSDFAEPAGWRVAR